MDPQGLLATKHLKNSKKDFNQTDMDRRDGFLSHVCCSIQCPNAWYFHNVREKDPARDWVVLFIEPHYLWAAGTRFCPWNAATKSGRDVHGGIKAFKAMFASRVVDINDEIYTRNDSHSEFLPTDVQAEVLILNRVAREDLLGIGVLDEAQARKETASLKERNAQIPGIWIVPDFFDKPRRLIQKLRSGFRPTAEVYRGG